MEIFGLGALLAAVGGALLWDARTQRRHVQRMCASWQRAGEIVQAGPVGTIAAGDLLAHATLRRAFGALAVVEGQVRFAGHRTPALDIAVPLESLRWVGTRARVKVAWNRRIETPELVLHTEAADGWHVFHFVEGALAAFAAQLGALAGLPVPMMGEVREDFGPVPAVPLVLDAVDGWRPAWPEQASLPELPESWEETVPLLYLAPDRLLFDRTRAILLERIRQVTALAPGLGADNPFGVTLLRVEHEDESGGHRVAGFLVANAGDWAGVLEARTGAVVEWRGARGDK
ncbi:MAG: hypothetical protein ACUVSU_12260 [Aggregatilineaceae bacterium]